MSRHNLTDSEWNAIRRFLPLERSGKVRHPWKPPQPIIDGILFVLHTGSQWKDPPSEFGKYKTVYQRFRRWVTSGIRQRIATRYEKNVEK